MYCLRANITHLSNLSRASFLSNVEPLSCSLRFFNDKRLVRKPLKKFKPTTSMKELEEYEDAEMYQSKLNQARAVTGKSFELITPRTRQPNSKIVASSSKKIEQGKIGSQFCRVHLQKLSGVNKPNIGKLGIRLESH